MSGRSRFLFLPIAVLALSLFLAPDDASSTIYVSKLLPGVGSSWSSPLNTISAAILAASPGEEIWVQRGIYPELLVVPGNGIRIYGGFHGWETSLSDRNWRTNPTVIDGVGLGGPVVTILPGVAPANNVIDGFVIQGGINTGGIGGGVSIVWSGGIPASAVVANCRFRDCVAGAGGGIGILSPAASSILNNEFVGCAAQTAGGGFGDGGAIYDELACGEIRWNHVGMAGCYGGGNGADNDGGGICLVSSDAQVTHNVIMMNRAAKGRGGGICARGSSAICHIDNNHVQHNYGQVAGGGICIVGGDPFLINNTLWDNRVVAGWCGGIALDTVGPVTVVNNLVTDNVGTQIEAVPPVTVPPVTMEFNDVWTAAGPPFYYAGILPIPPLDIQVDPLMQSACCAASVARPDSLGPCPNAGSNAWASLVAPAEDIDGEPRLDPSGLVDIGAEEWWRQSIVLTVGPSIQAMLDDAGPNRWVVVPAGMYTENLVMPPCVHLVGQPGALLAGGLANTMITVPHDSKVWIEGLDINGGHALQGGGINVGLCAEAHVIKCRIWDCFAEMDCSLFPNDPVGIGAGGLTYWAGSSSGEIRQCQLFNGVADQFSLASPSQHAMGGGIAMEAYASPLVFRNNIEMNTARWDGGGVWIHNYSYPVVRLNHIRSNRARIGGGVYVRLNAEPELCNNMVTDNDATDSGRGLAVYDGGFRGDYLSNTFADTLLGSVEEVTVFGVGEVDTFMNNIIYRRVPSAGSGLTGGPSINTNCTWPTNMGIGMWTDPLMNPAYHLYWYSPCKNAGVSAAACSAVDIDGEPRISVIIDIGADEYYSVSGAGDLPVIMRYDLEVQPNPFNPTTTFHCTLARGGDAEVRIYDLRGRLVRALPLGAVPAGRNDITWDGRDDDGRTLGSGVFFASLYADGAQVGAVRKLCLIK